MAILELESQVERESQLTQKHKSLLEPATSREAWNATDEFLEDEPLISLRE